MAFEEGIHAREPGWAEPETGAVSLEERPSQATAEQQAHDVSRHCRRADQRDHHEHRGVAALGGNPAEHQRQFTVDHEAEERGGLEEHQDCQGNVDPAAQGAGRVRQLAGQVGTASAPTAIAPASAMAAVAAQIATMR